MLFKIETYRHLCLLLPSGGRYRGASNHVGEGDTSVLRLNMPASSSGVESTGEIELSRSLIRVPHSLDEELEAWDFVRLARLSAGDHRVRKAIPPRPKIKAMVLETLVVLRTLAG